MVSLKSVGLVGLGNLIPPIAAALSMPLFARALGVDGRGDVAAATAPLMLAIVIATIGLPDALTYLVASSSRTLNLRRFLKAASLATLVAAAVALICVYFLRASLTGGDARIASLVVLSACFIPLALLVNLARGVAAGAKQWRLVALEQALSAALRLSAVLVLFVAGQLNLSLSVLIMSSAPVVGGIVYIPLIFRVLEFRRGNRADDSISRQPARHSTETGLSKPSKMEDADAVRGFSELASFGLRVWAGSLSGVLLLRLDQLLVLPLSDSRQLGLYVVAVNIAETILVINNAIRDVTFVSTASDTNLEPILRAARLSGVASLALAGVVAASMTVWFVPLFGAQFRSAQGVTYLMLFAVALGTPGSIAGAGLSGSGRPGLRSASLFIACVINGILIVLLVPRLGAYGAAIATVAGNLIASNVNIVFADRYLGTRWHNYYGIRRSDLRDAISHRVG